MLNNIKINIYEDNGISGLITINQEYLTVTDNGCGIPHNMMDNLFTPFFTSKPQGSGV